MTEKRFSFNWERGHPNFWDNDCDVADCYLTCEDVVKLLNELTEENIELKMKIQKVEEIIDNRLSNDFKPVWNDGKTELFIEEKVGYHRALKQLKKKLIKENIIVEDLE